MSDEVQHPEWFSARIADFDQWSKDARNQIVAEFICSHDMIGSGLIHCSLSVGPNDPNAPDAQLRCMVAAYRFFETLAQGREAFVREMPHVMAQRNFETDSMEVCGFVRFSVSPNDGVWHVPEPRSLPVRYLSFKDLVKS